MDTDCSLAALFGVLSLLDQIELAGNASDTTPVAVLMDHGLKHPGLCTEGHWDTIAATQRLLPELPTLGDYRSILRKIIDARSRSAVNHLNVLDLPNEILTEICRYFYPFTFLDTDRFATISMMDKSVQPDKTIQSLRLTCRRFRDASDPFLLTFPRVDVSEKSLVRFEELASHAIFGPSIRGVQVVLHYYAPEMAEHEEGFIGYNLDRLLHLGHSGLLDPTHNVYSWSGRLDRGKNETYRLWYRIAQEAYPEYVRRYKEQQRLRTDGSFLRRFSAALAKLKEVRRLEINDGPNWADHHDPYPRTKSPEDLKASFLRPHQWEESISDRSMILRPGLCWMTTDVLFGIPEAVGRAWDWIDNLSIDVTPLYDYTLLEKPLQERKKLTKSLQKLKTIQFKCSRWSAERRYGDRAELQAITDLLIALVDVPGLQRLILEMPSVRGQGSFVLEDQETQLHSFGSILTFRQWPELKSVYIRDMTIGIEEYETFLDSLHGRLDQSSLRFKGLHIVYPEHYLG